MPWDGICRSATRSPRPATRRADAAAMGAGDRPRARSRLRAMRRILAVAVLVGVCVTIGRGQVPAPRQVRLTLHEGTNMAAALSPDGQTIALDLLGTLWTMPAQGGAAKPIT